MIFKGNTKLTPALTEIIDDNTTSSNKTYSSNKIESLIAGGSGVVKIAEIEASTLTTLLTKQVTLKNTSDSQSINFELKVTDFNFLIPITFENREKYYYIFATDFVLVGDFQDKAKTGLIELSSGIKLGFGENETYNHDIQPYGSGFIGTIVFQNNILFKNMSVTSVTTNRVAYINIYIKKISGDATITPTTFTLDLTRGGNSGKAYVFGVPRSDT